MKNRMALYAVVIALMFAGIAPAQSLVTPQEIARTAKRATVQIRALDARGESIGAGSGFFISSDGLLVSNFHVVQGAAALQVERDDGEVFDNVFYVTSDPRRDTVILKIPVTNVTALRLGADEDVEIGSRVFVMGNPLGQTATFSDGLVSARRVVDGVQLLQVTAPISPGSSGGPAMNEYGEAIGIATMYLEGGQNLNYLVPVHYVRPMLAMGERPQRFSRGVLPTVQGGLANVGEGDADSSGSQGSSDAQGRIDAVTRRVVRSLAGQMEQVEAEMRRRSYSPSHDFGYGALDSNESENLGAVLDAGHSYGIVAVCDDDCSDLDLALLDAGGRIVGKDVTRSDVAVIAFTPRRSGNYRVNVRMYACSAAPCGYLVRIFDRN